LVCRQELGLHENVLLGRRDILMVSTRCAEVPVLFAKQLRTSDHLSVLVTAFWRRGKPRSASTPSVRLERRCSSEARTPSYRIGVALLAN
jgi:hypothetical protein